METIRIKRKFKSARAAIREFSESEARLSKLEREFEVTDLQASIREEADARRNADVERKMRTKRLLGLGERVAQIGLLRLGPDVLRGALLGAARFETGPYWRAKWMADGKAFLDSNAGIESSGRTEDMLGENAEGVVARRKAYNRRLIEAGGIVEQAGFDENTPPPLLIGILLAIRSKISDEKRIAAWRDTGAKAGVKKSPVEVRFPESIDRATSAALKKLGLSFDGERRVWHGSADFAAARRIASRAGGLAGAVKDTSAKAGKRLGNRRNKSAGRTHIRDNDDDVRGNF
jgi:hypothetical protein